MSTFAIVASVCTSDHVLAEQFVRIMASALLHGAPKRSVREVTENAVKSVRATWDEWPERKIVFTLQLDSVTMRLALTHTILGSGA